VVRGGGPPARAAFVRARRRQLAWAMARGSGTSDVAALLEELAAADQSPDALDQLGRRIGQLRFDDLVQAAAVDLDPDHLVVQIGGRHPAVDAALVTARAGTIAPRIAASETASSPPVDDLHAPTIPVVSRPARPVPAAPDADQQLWVGSPGNLHGPRRDGLFQGEREISLDQFLRLSGHPEVASEMKQRRWVRRGLVIGGAVAIAGSVGWVLVQADCEVKASYDDKEECRSRVGMVKAKAAAIAVGGGLMAAISSQLSSLRPSNQTLRGYAAEHNGKLRAGARTVGRGPGPGDVELAPALVPGGIGVVVGGRF